jgi:ABC-type lipoprotein export system ATPase subunit
MISLRGISKTYELPGGQSVKALSDVDLTIDRGEFMVITGRSGSGKTTLLNVATGLSKPSAGEVVLNGTSLWSLSDGERSHFRNRTMGFVFQFPSLLPSLSVLGNVTLPLAFGRDHPADGEARAHELLEMVGLGDRLSSYPRQLSAGQQQRVVIARALINEPELLMADEPSSDLDEDTENEIMSLFSRVHREIGITIVMVTHARQLVAYGTRHVQMAAGSLQTAEAAAV